MLLRKFNKEQKKISEAGKFLFSEYLREVIYGGNDGIVTTMAVVSGFVGGDIVTSTLPVSIVLLFGFANLFSDATSMGLSDYLGSKSEDAVSERRITEERKRIKKNSEDVEGETLRFLKKDGFRGDTSEEMLEQFRLNHRFWSIYLALRRDGIVYQESRNSMTGSFVAFLSFLIFGFLPLIPYMLSNQHDLYGWSLLCAFLALLILGGIRKANTKESWMKSVSEILIIGSISAFVAFGTGVIIGRVV